MKAWSYSALDSFEQCPRKYYEEKIARTVFEKKDAITGYGSTAHKHFENRLIKDTPLPLDLTHHERVLAKLAAHPGDGYPEQKIAVNRKYEATGFFDDDVWCRGVIDYVKINGGHALIIDHKFGKMRDKFDQLDLMVALVMSVKPDIRAARGVFYWAKSKKFTKKDYTRDDLPRIWDSFEPRVHHLQEAIKHENFPERPNGLCKRYCAVKACPHNGI